VIVEHENVEEEQDQDEPFFPHEIDDYLEL
jgi:hypothetical protein